MSNNNIIKTLISYLLFLTLIAAVTLPACTSGNAEPGDVDSSNIDSGKVEESAGPMFIPVLAYHKIAPAGTESTTGLIVNEDTFDEQMKYLHDNGFTTLTMEELYDWYNGKEVPEKSVVITFDDGYYSVYYLAYPIIRKYGQAATAFCIGHLIEEVTHEWDPDDSTDYRIGTDVIEKVRSEYPRFGFESHTYDMHRKIYGHHPAEIYSYEKMMEDFQMNKGFGFSYLAYPWGDYNDTFKQALTDSGYKMAFIYREYYYARRTDDRFAIHRIKISGKMDMEMFKRIVNCEEGEPIAVDD